MKVEQSSVTKLFITKSKVLDPITVFLEDFEEGKGAITIVCYGQAWNAYWGAMGGRTIVEFVCAFDEDYIANRLGASRRDEAYVLKIVRAVKEALSQEQVAA